MKIGKTIARSLAVATVSVLAVMGLSLPKADASSCVLSISFLGSNQYRVTVGCNDLFVDGFTLEGEDTFSDDTLFSISGSSTIVLGDVLDEDLWDSDEVYANVGAHDLSG